MVTFHREHDPHSLSIHRDGKWIGHLLWHSGRPARLQLAHSVLGGDYLAIDELKACSDKLQEVTRRPSTGVQNQE